MDLSLTKNTIDYNQLILRGNYRFHCRVNDLCVDSRRLDLIF